jgi:NADH-quinone oxidoreductase subunit N
MLNFDALWMELGVLAVTLLVFTADLFAGEKRGLGALGAVGLAVVLLASFSIDHSGTALYGTYVADGAALFFKRVLLLAGIIGCVGSVDHVDRVMPDRQGEHYLMMLFSLIGMMLLTGARDLLLWVVAFELAGIPLTVLASMHKDARGAEAGLKLYLSGAASTAIILYGVSFLWGYSGDTAFSGLSAGAGIPAFNLGVLLLLGGVAFKIGLAPFHLWVADTYQGAPAPAVAFMSVAPKIAVVASLARLLNEGLADQIGLWLTPLIVLSVVTLLVGNLTAITQPDARRLLALSGVGHMGLMLLALLVGGEAGLAALMFYALAYVVTNMGAFLAVGAVVDGRGDGSMAHFNGLIKGSPALSTAMLIFLFSLGGIPFMVGFWGKLFVFWAAWLGGYQWLVVMGVMISVVGLFYYLRLARAVFIEPALAPEGDGADYTAAVPVGWPSLVALGVCAALTVGFGVLPGPFMEAALDAAALLAH